MFAIFVGHVSPPRFAYSFNFVDSFFSGVFVFCRKVSLAVLDCHSGVFLFFLKVLFVSQLNYHSDLWSSFRKQELNLSLSLPTFVLLCLVASTKPAAPPPL